ncbi:hypothetical protein OMP38_17125 [Cohnella ginsengisoli]|uniref:Uncharacterized protein n=1 Tax=Cohnella ginsengisoli TaxID=425004 RepID=A0A9X4KHR4_9BACL|nr:hypothetical protein [Cohnella ginsengisoli]MDG0792402.1 hypothetical protein [Cohnella ginsengisoli]
MDKDKILIVPKDNGNGWEEINFTDKRKRARSDLQSEFSKALEEHEENEANVSLVVLQVLLFLFLIGYITHSFWAVFSGITLIVIVFWSISFFVSRVLLFLAFVGSAGVGAWLIGAQFGFAPLYSVKYFIVGPLY